MDNGKPQGGGHIYLDVLPWDTLLSLLAGTCRAVSSNLSIIMLLLVLPWKAASVTIIQLRPAVFTPLYKTLRLSLWLSNYKIFLNFPKENQWSCCLVFWHDATINFIKGPVIASPQKLIIFTVLGLGSIWLGIQSSQWAENWLEWVMRRKTSHFIEMWCSTHQKVECFHARRYTSTF